MLNPNIAALQFAERELRDHDRRTDELSKELKELKKTRAAKAARVQGCIDVLCGKVTPDLFADVADATDEPQADGGLVIIQCPKCLVFSKPGQHECEAVADGGPIVCAEVGSGKLADIAGITAADAKHLDSMGFVTLADVDKACGGDLDSLHATLGEWEGFLPAHEIKRIADAITAHLRPATVPEELPSRCPKLTAMPADDDWREQPLKKLVLKPVWSALAGHEVETVGDLFDWMQEDAIDGGIFGLMALHNHLLRVVGRSDSVGRGAVKKAAEAILNFLAKAGFRHAPHAGEPTA